MIGNRIYKTPMVWLSTGLLSLGQAAMARGEAQRPNILFFLVDDMGWQDTSLPFGPEKTSLNELYRTPYMERLAAKGVKFTHAYACSISSPSRVSLFTGANVTQHRVSNWTLHKDTPTDRASDVLDFGEWNYNGLCPVEGVGHTFHAKCLPQILRENGYTTMMVGKAHFGSIDTPAADPLAIGFDYNVAGHAAGAMGSYLGEENYGNIGNEWAKVWGVPDLEKYYGSSTFLTEALTLEAKRLIDTALVKEKPFFLYMSHYAVHAPYKEDKRFIERYKNRGLSQAQAEYAAIVEGMDKSLGDLMDYLDEKGISENTVVVFMSDNGGYINSRGVDMNAPLSGGKGSLLEGGIREPMIVYWPGVTCAGSEEDMPVIVEDFFPTFLEMAGVKRYRTPQRVDGKSFVPVLRGKNIRGERPLFFHYPNNWGERKGIVGVPQSAIIKGNMKYIYCYENGESFLYDLDRDISERHNLMNDRMYAGIADVLRRELSDYLRRQKANMPVDKRSGEQVAYPDGKK